MKFRDDKIKTMNALPKRYQKDILHVIRNALAEDIGDGDITSNTIFSEDIFCSGTIIAKASGVIAGIEVARQIYYTLDARIRFYPKVKDGELINNNTVIARVAGPCRAVISGERTVLNFIQRMSGIATSTRKFVDAVAKNKTAPTILDTRKTAPGLRAIDKWAVILGGGQNHRYGLFDMVLIKENHIKAAGCIRAAVECVRKGDKKKRSLEVEVKDLDELQEAIDLQVDRIMLDNMTPDRIREAVLVTGNRIPLEASGNISLDNVEKIAATGVNFISVGQLTHSVKALDISFLLDEESK